MVGGRERKTERKSERERGKDGARERDGESGDGWVDAACTYTKNG